MIKHRKKFKRQLKKEDKHLHTTETHNSRGAKAVSILGCGFRKIPMAAYISDPIKNRNKNCPPKMRD